MSLRLLRRRMRDHPRHFVYFKLPFGRLPSAIFQHVRRTRVVNAILFGSRLLVLQLPSIYSLLRFSPTSGRSPIGDVWMGSFSLNSCRIQTVCLIYRQRLDCLHSPFCISGFLRRAIDHAIFYSRSSFSVPRFQFLVFRFRFPRFSFSV